MRGALILLVVEELQVLDQVDPEVVELTELMVVVMEAVELVGKVASEVLAEMVEYLAGEVVEVAEEVLVLEAPEAEAKSASGQGEKKIQ